MAKDRVQGMRGNFESKYGAPTNPDAQVLIGMRGGKAVYGSELDAADTSGKNVINNTYSQNQAIMDDMFKGMKQSGGMYNPSPTAVAKMDQMYPPTAADSAVTARADGKQMIGVNSPEATSMREKTVAPKQYEDTMARINARPNLTSVGAAGKPEAPASPITPASPTAPASPKVGGFVDPLDYRTPLASGSNIALVSVKQTGGPTNAAATIPPMSGGEVPTDADILKELRRRIMRRPTMEVRKEDSEFSDRFGPRDGILAFGDNPAEWGL